jgi:hypothetical protein
MAAAAAGKKGGRERRGELEGVERGLIWGRVAARGGSE